MSLLRIGQAARATGVSASNIRFYEKAGLLPVPARQDNDYRSYNAADLHRLRFIRMCRLMDMSLDEIRALLALDCDNPHDCHAAIGTVAAHLAHVRQRLHELQQLEVQLQALHECCTGDCQPDVRCNLIATLHARADAVDSAPPSPTPCTRLGCHGQRPTQQPTQRPTR